MSQRKRIVNSSLLQPHSINEGSAPFLLHLPPSRWPPYARTLPSAA